MLCLFLFFFCYYILPKLLFCRLFPLSSLTLSSHLFVSIYFDFVSFVCLAVVMVRFIGLYSWPFGLRLTKVQLKYIPIGWPFPILNFDNKFSFRWKFVFNLPSSISTFPAFAVDNSEIEENKWEQKNPKQKTKIK